MSRFNNPGVSPEALQKVQINQAYAQRHGTEIMEMLQNSDVLRFQQLDNEYGQKTGPVRPGSPVTVTGKRPNGTLISPQYIGDRYNPAVHD